MNNEYLIVFTRYPEVGKTKTRLIPVLGAEGAANLQRQMTEHTLNQVKEVQINRSLSIGIYFSGGNAKLMQNWLGDNFIYYYQSDGDLGMRMANAFQTCFNNKINHPSLETSVAIIGIDCPSLNSQIMNQAFDSLLRSELVIGPAVDGGYYLMGMRRFIPQLFQGINWGTSEVMKQTIQIAETLGLAIAYLPTLADIDRPEDLATWQSKI